MWYSPVGGAPVHGSPVADGGAQTAYAVKWSVLLALFVIFFLWITLGYYHARRRIKAGLKPLAYHKVDTAPDKTPCADDGQWLVPRSQREPRPSQNVRSYYAPGSYGMEHAEPPPGQFFRG
jgi:hypothetical protein